MGSIDTYPASFSSTSNAVLGTSTSVTSGAAVTDADTDLSVTISVPTAGRTIRITMVEPNLSGTVANDGFDVKIQEGVTVLQDLPWFVITGNIQPRTATVVAIVSPTAGVHTYKGHITRFTGTGTLQPLRGAASNAFLIVEDITGGTGGPGPIQLAYAEGTAAQTGISAETTLTFSSVTVSVPAGRRIKISSQVQLSSATTSGTSLLRIKEGATALQVAQGNYNTIAGNGWALRAEVVITPTAGTHTYFLTVQGTAGTVGVDFGVGVIPYILVEDITGTPSPAGIMPTSQVLAYSQAVANQTGITAEVDLTSLTVTVSVPDGRRIRISGQALWNSTGASPTITMRIREGATELNEYQIVGHPSIGNGASGHIDVVVTPSAGIHTYKLTGAATASSSLLAGTTFPAYIMVEDITGGSPAALPVNVPVGQLAYAEFTSNQATITTEVDITNLSVNVVVPSGRTLKVTIHCGDIISTVANDGAILRAKVDGTEISEQTATLALVGQAVGMDLTTVVSPSAGSHTIKATMARFAGTGSITVQGSGTAKNYILVEDVTPTPTATTGAPSSTLAYAEVTASQSGISTVTDLTGLAVTVTVPAGRRIRIVGKIAANGTVASSTSAMNIKEGATSLQNIQIQNSTTPGNGTTLEGDVIISPSAGTHTYKLTLELSAGTGTVGMAAGAAFPAYILVEDITASTYTYSQPGVLPVNSTALPAGPQIGAMVYEIDTGATKIYNGTSWQIFGQGSSQTLGYAEITANTSTMSSATPVDVAGLSVTVTVPAGRRLRISSHALLLGNTNGDGARLMIVEGATTLRLADTDIDGSKQEDVGAEVIITPSAGSHTYKIQFARWTGSGTVQILANAQYPAFLLVEDITGTNAPAPAVNVPVGQLAYAQVVANQTTITTEVDLTGLSVNVVVPSGRVLRISCQTIVASSVTDDSVRVNIMEGATQLHEIAEGQYLAGRGITLSGKVVISPSAGSHTYKLTIQREAGTGSVTNFASTTNPAFILVEDITPTPTAGTGAPSSTLGYAEALANQGTFTAETDLTGLSVTVTVPAGRRIKISAKARLTSSVANDEIVLKTKEGATILAGGTILQVGSANIAGTVTADVVISPSAGSHTYKLTAGRVSGSGNITMVAASTDPAYILVEDITGSVWPAGSQVTAGIVASEAWTAYTPTWTSSGTAPVIGNGTLTGRYIKIGRTVIGVIYFAGGSSSTYGTGNYSWSLPVAPSNSLFAYQIVGSGKGYSSGSNLNAIATINNGAQALRLVYSATWPTGSETLVGQLTPWTWTTSNDLTIHFTYEAVS